MPPCSFRGGRSHGLNTSKKFIGAGRIQHTYTYAFFVHAFAFGIGPHPQLRTLGLSLELRLPFHLENIHMHMGLDPIEGSVGGSTDGGFESSTNPLLLLVDLTPGPDPQLEKKAN